MDIKSVRLDCRTFEEAGRYIARCDKLALSDHGATPEEAFEHLVETTRLFFQSCIRRGTIGRILALHGVEFDRDAEPDSGETGRGRFVVPMPWMVLSGHDDHHRVH